MPPPEIKQHPEAVSSTRSARPRKCLSPFNWARERGDGRSWGRALPRSRPRRLSRYTQDGGGGSPGRRRCPRLWPPPSSRRPHLGRPRPRLPARTHLLGHHFRGRCRGELLPGTGPDCAGAPPPRGHPRRRLRAGAVRIPSRLRAPAQDPGLRPVSRRSSVALVQGVAPGDLTGPSPSHTPPPSTVAGAPGEGSARASSWTACPRWPAGHYPGNRSPRKVARLGDRPPGSKSKSWGIPLTSGKLTF